MKCEERDKIQLGYSSRYDVLAWVQNNRIVLSYGNNAESKIDELKEKIVDGVGTKDLKEILSEVYDREVTHHIKFVYSNTIIKRKNIKQGLRNLIVQIMI